MLFRSGCPHPGGPHAAQFLICQKCGAVAELDDPAIGQAIESGAASEVVIARNGRPVARLTSLQPSQRPRSLGVAQGQFTAPASIDASNPLIAALFDQE